MPRVNNNSRGKNGHLEIPPEEWLREKIDRYYHMGIGDTEMLPLLKDLPEFKSNGWGLGLTTLKSLRKKWGYQGTRQQHHTVDSIKEAAAAVRRRYPLAGERDMKMHLQKEHKMKVPKRVINAYFQMYEPEGIKQRKARKLKRKRFWAAGVNDLWAFDQHDKWQRFGLWLHTGIEPFTGKIFYIRVWWTNKNPRLIANYYLDVVKELGFMPLVTQSDPGSENYGIANAHTALRHYHDPSLKGTLQHRWMRSKKNVKPEITWSQMRRRFTPGFENILEVGIDNGWYDPDEPLETLVFRWTIIPWLQGELDDWVVRHNSTAPRADKNKVLPHGRPDILFEHAHMNGCLNFKVTVDPNAITEMRRLYAPPENQVLQLVPPAFDKLARQFYHDLGSPEINSESVWGVYYDLLQLFVAWEDMDEVQLAIEAVLDEADEQPMEKLPDLRELRNGDEVVGPDGYYYMGGVDKGFVGRGDTVEGLQTGGGIHEIQADGQSKAERRLAAIREQELSSDEELYVKFSDESNSEDESNNEDE